MADVLLDRILREIRQRLDESRAAHEETQRLQEALVALDQGQVESLAQSPAPRRRARRSAPRRRARRSAPRAGRRAPKGENLRRIREVIEERPGATAGEVSSTTGIARATVASTLGKLARDGELERTELPGSRVGFRPARERPEPAATSEPTSTDVIPGAGTEPAPVDSRPSTM